MSRKLHRPRRLSPRLAPIPRSLELDIASLGARGDGVARHGSETVFVPFTVPGDRVLAQIDGRRGDGFTARPLEILSAGPGRQEPPCPHFGRCGGCSLQHLAPAAASGWKHGVLADAFGRAGIDPAPIAPMISIAPGTRRRAAFAFGYRRIQMLAGFTARASHDIVDLEQCFLLAPPLFARLAPLRAALTDVIAPGSRGDAIACLTDTGIDLLIEGEARLDLFDRQRLAAFAEASDLARLSWRFSHSDTLEPVAHRRDALVDFGGIPVSLPPGAFLQPSIEGERALAALVLEAVGDSTRIADLYAGCGSFSFPLSGRAAVTAIEGDRAAIGALKSAADRAGREIRTECRDLAHRPLSADELAPFHAVVFDPPRAGATAQAEALAAAGPQRVVAVSCNPATLARDARILVEGGYCLRRATPVDQFPWSAHLEVVAVFERSS